jgi:hypothetical protein
MAIQLCFLALTSPQNRFIVAFVLFFSLLLLSLFLQKETTIYYTFYCSLILVFLSVLYPIQLGENHQRMDFKTSSFSYTQFVYPKSNSNLKTTFSSKSIGNLKYFSPDAETYIWATGDGKLPCVNSQQVEYFKTKLGYIPQLNGKTLHDGFYSKKIKTP